MILCQRGSELNLNLRILLPSPAPPSQQKRFDIPVLLPEVLDPLMHRFGALEQPRENSTWVGFPMP